MRREPVCCALRIPEPEHRHLTGRTRARGVRRGRVEGGPGLDDRCLRSRRFNALVIRTAVWKQREKKEVRCAGIDSANVADPWNECERELCRGAGPGIEALSSASTPG